MASLSYRLGPSFPVMLTPTDAMFTYVPLQLRVHKQRPTWRSVTAPQDSSHSREKSWLCERILSEMAFTGEGKREWEMSEAEDASGFSDREEKTSKDLRM